MKYIWTVAGDDPDYDNGAENGIDGYFFPMWDSLTTPETVAAARARPEVRAIGIYYGHGWRPSLGPVALAQEVHQEYKRITKYGTVNGGLRVMFNLEQHDPDFIAATMEAWRKLRPTVGTSWSPEGMQGGWMSPQFVSRILASRIRVVPQCFTGPMERRESDIVLRDLLDRGFPASVISMFYDAADLGVDWNGFAFTMGRLPWLL